MNYALYRNIPKAVRIVKEENPEVLMKCVKNAAEIENIRRGHIKDGVAHTKFMYWLKKHAGKETITELSASEKLENFRKEQEGYLWPSFDPICAYGQHAADRALFFYTGDECGIERRRTVFDRYRRKLL